MSQAKVYLIPGYLSQNTSLPYVPHDIDPDDESLGIWGSFGRDFARQVDAPVAMLNWKAGTGFLELIEGKIGWIDFTGRMVFQFGFAIEEADRAATLLADHIEAANRPAIVVGHSMGGRVALKVREHCSVPVIAFAPSAAACEIDWERFGNSKEPAECYHSRYDYMIGLYGGVRPAPWGTILGVHGVPIEHRDMLRSIDVSLRKDGRPRGHADYLLDWLELLQRYSTILQPRSAGKAPWGKLAK